MPQALKQDAIKTYLGYAVTDKEQNSRLLNVYCPELLPFVSGELTALEISNDVSTNSTRGGNRSASIKSTNFITCEYRGEDTNRGGPPDVRKGEEVVVFNYGDHNQFYWKSSARNDGNRRTETYRVEISGTLENAAQMDDNNTYFFEMDTRRSHRIRISTSNQDGETYRYLFTMDADKGTFILSDDTGNMIHIDSAVPRVCMKNNKNTMFDLNGENIVIMCNKDITMISNSGNINIDARKGTMYQHSKGDMSMITNAKMIQTSDADMLITTHANRTTAVDSNDDLTVKGNYSATVEGTYASSSKGNMSLSTEGSLSTSSKSDSTLSSQAAMNLSCQSNGTFSSSAALTLSSGANLSLSAGGGLSISFNGAGTMSGNGGSLTMKMSHLAISN